MLRSMQNLEGYSILATDGTIGHVKDFYFDDQAWVIRYLIVDTGNWLSSRKVLISPIALGPPNWEAKVLPVSITREQVKHSPAIDTEKPVSRQHEIDYLGYYHYPYYWGGAGLWGGAYAPGLMLGGVGYAGAESEASYREEEQTSKRDNTLRHGNDDPHLRSCKAVHSYHIHAKDGEIGHVSGMLIDEDSWAVRYLIVDTSNWWVGHKVLIAPQWIEDISWPDATVSVALTRQAVRDAPHYESAELLNREQELKLYRHYGWDGYWIDHPSREPALTD